MKLRGVIPPIVTPLHEDETIHEGQLRRLTEYLLGKGVHAIFVNGSMGVFNLLKDEQQFRAIGVVVDQVAGRVPVMAGAAETSTSRVIDKAQRIVELGADYLSICRPTTTATRRPRWCASIETWQPMWAGRSWLTTTPGRCSPA
jgi:4-hydroxy-tetrahydrodipicolinate synthase